LRSRGVRGLDFNSGAFSVRPSEYAPRQQAPAIRLIAF
jgi:hypothetical protein